MTGTILSANLGLRLEDPSESVFTEAAKVDAINMGQRTVVNVVDNTYLDESKSFYSMDDGKLMSVVVKAIQELSAKVDSLEQQLSSSNSNG